MTVVRLSNGDLFLHSPIKYSVWRFNPPFGQLQIAYQKGTSAFGTTSFQGHTIFTKLAWVL